MPLPRLHLFELEDQPWFPSILRDLATDYLHFIETKSALHRPVVPILGALLRETRQERVVDLCSGGGGPIPSLLEELTDRGISARFTLTDWYPNTSAFERVAAAAPSSISFVPEPIDARAVPAALTGVRTMFNAFHHFAPDDAVAVLRSAAAAGQPIAIFEIPDRRLRTLIPLFLLTCPIVLLTTPFIRPFRWSRLFWTYLLPLVPLTCWWDGWVSQLRAYTPEEMHRLAGAVGVAGFSWKSGRVPIGAVPGDLTYLVGMPSNAPPLRR